MKNALATAFAVMAFAACADATAPKSSSVPKAIMIMVDGLRADAVENAPMRNLLRLRDGKWQPGYKGFSSNFGLTLHDARPSSAANHSAIATGASAAKTGVYKNGDTPKGNFGQWPSWLVRLVNACPDKTALYAYSWTGDVRLSPNSKVQNLPITSVVTNNWPVGGSYAMNATAVSKLISAPEAPDAILYFIDFCDWGGHRSGFYPYGGEYLHDVLLADRIIGDILASISSRPSFAHEDWLVMVTSDHGGYRRKHGMWGGHATTVPLVIAGRHIPEGRIAGTPRNYDLAPMALEHFGIDTSAMKLDGKAPSAVFADPVRDLKDGLAVYMDFDAALPSNAVPCGPAPEAHGATKSGVGSGVFDRCLHVASGDSGACGVSLKGSEELEFENGGDFAISLWVRLDDRQMEQAPIVSNKNWESGRNPGMVLVGARKTDGVKESGVCFNCALSDGRQRLDMGTFDIDYGVWCFYAVTMGSDRVLRIYQGGRDGRLYWIADNAKSAVLKTGLPFRIGQDGTGKCKVSMNGDVDDFALWTRALSHEDVRRIYDAGRSGRSLGDMMNAAERSVSRPLR